MQRFYDLEDHELRWLWAAMDAECDQEDDRTARRGKRQLYNELEAEMIRRNLSLN